MGRFLSSSVHTAPTKMRVFLLFCVFSLSLLLCSGKKTKHYLIETHDKGWGDYEGEPEAAYQDFAGSCGAACEDHLSCPESCGICRTETIEEYDTGVKTCHPEPH